VKPQTTAFESRTRFAASGNKKRNLVASGIRPRVGELLVFVNHAEVTTLTQFLQPLAWSVLVTVCGLSVMNTMTTV
jgi:hypothetical protein